MLWTEKTERALNKAAELHDGQHRKGDRQLPFITHPIAVASIVSKFTDDDDIVAAALLHDTIEDTAYTREEMQKDFGDSITEIVLGVTIPEAHEGEPHTWTSDRTRYIENLKKASMESAMVAAADKIHNFNSVLEDYSGKEEQYKKDFGGTSSDRVHVYGTIVQLISERIPDAFAKELNESWRKYKTFVESLDHI